MEAVQPRPSAELPFLQEGMLDRHPLTTLMIQGVCLDPPPAYFNPELPGAHYFTQLFRGQKDCPLKCVQKISEFTARCLIGHLQQTPNSPYNILELQLRAAFSMTLEPNPKEPISLDNIVHMYKAFPKNCVDQIRRGIRIVEDKGKQALSSSELATVDEGMIRSMMQQLGLSEMAEQLPPNFIQEIAANQPQIVNLLSSQPQFIQEHRLSSLVLLLYFHSLPEGTVAVPPSQSEFLLEVSKLACDQCRPTLEIDHDMIQTIEKNSKQQEPEEDFAVYISQILQTGEFNDTPLYQFDTYLLLHLIRKMAEATFSQKTEEFQRFKKLICQLSETIAAFDPAIIEKQTKMNPLYFAIQYQMRTFAHFLLEIKKIDPNGYKTAGGATALHLAAMKGDQQMCQLLLDYKADKTAQTTKGSTPAQIAENRGHAELAKLLAI